MMEKTDLGTGRKGKRNRTYGLTEQKAPKQILQRSVGCRGLRGNNLLY